MKKIYKLLGLFIVSVLSFSFFVGFTNPAVEVKAAEANEGTVSASQKYVNAMEPGWNLGNTYDSFDNTVTVDRGETSWGNPVVTKDLIKAVKAQGFKSIRMPFTALMRTGPAPDYKLNPEYLAKYAQTVQWALDEGLYVMTNLHSDCAWWAKNIDSDNGEAMKRYIAISTQFATYFKDYSDKLCFESLNEPQFDPAGDVTKQIKILEKVNTQYYNIVRNSGGKNATRMLVLPTLVTNDSDDRCESLYNTIKALNDPNIIATFHYYGFYPFGVNYAGFTTFNDKVKTELQNAFTRMNNHFTSKGIGVILGEYGTIGWDIGKLTAVEHGELLKYYEYLTYYSKSKNITMMYWDAGQGFGRTSFVWSDPALYNMIKASWTSRSSYAESDRIFIKDRDRKQDVSMKLALNGNTLKSIYNGSKQLIVGKDYVYNNDTVTLNGSYIDSVLKSDLGESATLTMKFSAGADWDVYISHYEQPVFGDGQANTLAKPVQYEIPVQYNGSRITTLEAVNADGTGAGGQSWTTYKQFNSDFTPDYNANKLIIKENFFKEIKPGKITLKIHFQSGEILEYIFMKK